MPVIPYGDIPRYYAQRKPEDALAVIYPDGALTWRELESRANRWARLFRSAGVAEGDFLTLSMPNGPAFVEAMFGAWKCGAVANPVSWRLPGNLPHIGIVSTKVGLVSRRPLLVHNIGAGSQLEDVLFAWPRQG